MARIWGGLTFEEVAGVGRLFVADGRTAAIRPGWPHYERGSSAHGRNPRHEDDLSGIERRLADWPARRDRPERRTPCSSPPGGRPAGAGRGRLLWPVLVAVLLAVQAAGLGAWGLSEVLRAPEPWPAVLSDRALSAEPPPASAPVVAADSEPLVRRAAPPDALLPARGAWMRKTRPAGWLRAVNPGLAGTRAACARHPDPHGLGQARWACSIS